MLASAPCVPGPGAIRALRWLLQSRPRSCRHSTRVYLLLARRAGKRRHDVAATTLVDQFDRRAVRTDHPAVPPSEQRNHHRVEVHAFFGEPIFEAPRMVLVLNAHENAVIDELPQPGREAMAGQAQVM